MKLSVVSWNIHKAIGGLDRRYRPERVIEVLRHHEPDIILLQEVDEGARRSQYHTQLELIGDALGMRHRCFQITHRLRSEGHYGNAILSRWPLYDVHQVDLTIGTRKRRGAVWAHARVRFGSKSRTVTICNLHLGLAGSERREQLRVFLGCDPFKGLHVRTPLIVGGDFNDLYGTLGPDLLEPVGFRRAGTGKPPRTFPSYAPLRPLDAIFLRGDLRAVDCKTSHLALARVASDHLPLVAHLQVHR
jgi:endonuclease/exonuclease/phosphatase family metal-dependent hydrolase